MMEMALLHSWKGIEVFFSIKFHLLKTLLKANSFGMLEYIDEMSNETIRYLSDKGRPLIFLTNS